MKNFKDIVIVTDGTEKQTNFVFDLLIKGGFSVPDIKDSDLIIINSAGNVSWNNKIKLYPFNHPAWIINASTLTMDMVKQFHGYNPPTEVKEMTMESLNTIMREKFGYEVKIKE